MSIIHLRTRINAAFEALKAKEGLCCSIVGDWNPLLETDVFIQCSQVTDTFTNQHPKACKEIIHLVCMNGRTGDICPFCKLHYLNPDLYTRADYLAHFKIVDGLVTIVGAAAIPLWIYTKIRETIQSAV
jgi:hypothetical protein